MRKEYALSNYSVMRRQLRRLILCSHWILIMLRPSMAKAFAYRIFEVSGSQTEVLMQC